MERPHMRRATILLILLGAFTAMRAEASRTLSFPPDGWMGNLYLVPESGLEWNPKGVWPESQLEYLSAARGEVCVPDGRDVRLWVRLGLTPREAARLQRQNPRAYETSIGNRVREYPGDLAGLSQLDPNGLFWLSVNSPTYRRTGVAPAVFEPIRRLTGLKMLGLHSTGITDAGLEHLRALRLLKGLELTQFPIRARALAVLEDLPELEYLSLNTGLTDAGLKRVAQISSLRWLRISGGKMWGPGLAELERLPRLERLCFWDAEGSTPVTDRHLKYLEGVTQLKSLTLHGVGEAVTDAGLASISRIENLEELYFVMGNPKFTPAGVAHLQNLKHLKKVDFGGAWVSPVRAQHGDDIARLLAVMDQLESIERIGYLSAEGMKALATMPDLKCLNVTLKHRRLGYYGPTGLSHLARLRSLEDLFIGSSDQLPDADIASLEALRRLKKLTIFFSGVSDRGLASIGKLKQLEHLRVNVLTRSGMNHLNGLPNLQYLNVTSAREDGNWTVSAGEATLDLSGLKKVKELCLSQLWLKDGDLTFLKHLPALENVVIQQTTPLTSAFFGQLGELPELNRLRVWGLTDCTGADLAHLNGLPKLRSLIVTGEITDAALASLKGPACLESLHVDTDHPIRQETIEALTATHPVIEHIHINTLTPVQTPPARRPRPTRPVPTRRRRGRR